MNQHFIDEENALFNWQSVQKWQLAVVQVTRVSTLITTDLLIQLLLLAPFGSGERFATIATFNSCDQFCGSNALGVAGAAPFLLFPMS